MRGISKEYISLKVSGVNNPVNASVLLLYSECVETLIYLRHGIIKVVRFCPLVKAPALWSRVRIYVDRCPNTDKRPTA